MAEDTGCMIDLIGNDWEASKYSLGWNLNTCRNPIRCSNLTDYSMGQHLDHQISKPKYMS